MLKKWHRNQQYDLEYIQNCNTFFQGEFIQGDDDTMTLNLQERSTLFWKSILVIILFLFSQI